MADTDSDKPTTRRQALCLDCRTALNPGETCDGGRRHRVVHLSTAAAREELLREVWGPPGLRRKAKKMAAAGGGGAAVGGAVECGEVGCGIVECAGSTGELIPIVAAILLAAFAGVLVYLLVAYIVRFIRRRRNRLKPNGARRAPLPPPGQRYSGTIANDAPTVTSLTGEHVAAFGLRLTSKQFLGSSVMLLDGVSAGFPVRLADGRVVNVPPGRARVEGPVGRGTAVTQIRVEGFLAELDPLRKNVEAVEELEPIPYDEALELTLKPGDPVELVGKLELVPDASAAAGGYRDAAPSLLEPTGPVLLRLAPRSR